MSVPSVAGVVTGVKAPIGWLKARPVVFVVLTLVIVVLAIKYAPKILGWIAKTPVVGGKVVAFATNTPAP